MKKNTTLVLASASPRRRELLGFLTDQFETRSAEIDETPHIDETPSELVKRLAIEKASSIATAQPLCSVLGSDTIVAIEQQNLGKPRDKNDFIGMMARLSGRRHQVYTAVCLIHQEKQRTILVETQVEFAKLDSSEVERYWATGEPADKAGGYAIQGIGGQFVKQIQGSVSAVIGLPLLETKSLLREAGIIQ